MKATIEFNLPDEHDEHLRCVHARDAWLLLWEIDSHLSSVIRHGEGGYKTPEELAEFVRKQIYELTCKLDT